MGNEMGYAGLFFNLVLASLVHHTLNDPGMTIPFLAIILLLTSYFFAKTVRA